MKCQQISWTQSVQSSHSVMSNSLPPNGLHTPGFLPSTNSRSLLKIMFIESVMPFTHLILCRPLLLWPSIFPNLRVFSIESVLHIRWPKYWSLSFSISPSSDYSGLISFRMDWLDLLEVQGTLKSLLQDHSSKASVLKIALAIRDFLYFHTNCEIICSSSVKNTIGSLIGVALNL